MDSTPRNSSIRISLCKMARATPAVRAKTAANAKLFLKALDNSCPQQVHINLIVNTYQMQMETHVKNIFIFAATAAFTLPVIASGASKSSVTLYGIADAGFVRVSNVKGSTRQSIDSGYLQPSRFGLRKVCTNEC